MKYTKGFTLLELLVVISIIGLLSSIVLAGVSSARTKGRDAQRISSLRQIAYALELYYGKFGLYPTCLVPGGSCTTTLQGSGFIGTIANDPSGVAYTYAANGSGATCNGYHLGASLEEKTHRILQSDADATVKAICTGSNADFSGISYALGGQQCNATAGTAQPTGLANGGTCYDLVNHQ